MTEETLNEDKAREELDRANRARVILEDDLFLAAIDAIKDQLWSDFAKSRIDDDNLRRNARIGVDMLDRILSALRHHITTGKFAVKTLAEIEEKRKWRISKE